MPEVGQLAERRGPAEQVDGDDRLRPLGHAGTYIARVEVHRPCVDVDEHRLGAAPRDRLRGRVEREARADDLVAVAHVQSVERDHQRVRPVRDPDRMCDTEVRGGLLLEGAHVRAEDEPPRVEDFGDSLLQLVQQRRVLRLDVNQRDLRHGGPS